MPLLSVLDQSPVRSGGTPADAIHESLELAELADRLGYHRYWLAEHHSTPGLGGSSPQGLIGPGAARPSPVRVGIGRAAGRGRGEISGGAVSLKKKKEEHDWGGGYVRTLNDRYCMRGM